MLTAITLTRGNDWNRLARFLVVLAGAAGLKIHYSISGPDGLRWILAPTAFCVDLVTGSGFEYERHAGYLSDDRTFLIAASCAGVNFMIAALLVLTLPRLLSERQNSWPSIAYSFATAYLATIAANTVRISAAIQHQWSSADAAWLAGDDFHRIEGIFIYFGFLLVLFLASGRSLAADRHIEWHSPRPVTARIMDRFRRCMLPLGIYYSVAIGVPLINGGYMRADFWEHSLAAFLIPIVLVLFVAAAAPARRRSDNEL